MKRIRTSKTGVYYHQLLDGDKVYYITYKDLKTNKKIWLKIGTYSQGVRENYCVIKRNEILTMMRLGEEPPAVAKNKKRKINYLSHIATSYFNQRKDNSTTKSDRAIFEYYISPYFEDIDLIDKSSIEKWNKYLEETTQKNNDKKKLSVKYQNDIKGLLVSIDKYALTNDFTKNDFSKYITKESVDNARDRFLTKEEIQILYKYFEDEPTMILFLKIALTTGARLNSILYIKKKDLDLNHNLITLKDFKNNTTYKSFLTDELNQLLISHIQELQTNESLFPTNPQSRLLGILDDLFNQGLDPSDTKHRVVIHTFRHTFASHLAINGTPIYTIQRLMNHKDITMTLRYAKLAPDSGRDSISGLNF